MRGQRSLPAVALLIAGMSATGFLAPRPAVAGIEVPIGLGCHDAFGHRHVHGFRPDIPKRHAGPKRAPERPPKAEAPSFAYDRAYCRAYSRSTVIDGRRVEVKRRACRQKDGTWHIID